ncbi:MAG: helix-turn-helix domain-containing protein [Thermoactinomyces sp.]
MEQYFDATTYIDILKETGIKQSHFHLVSVIREEELIQHAKEEGIQDEISICFIGEGVYDLWSEDGKKQFLRIDEILERKAKPIEALLQPEQVKKDFQKELNSHHVYVVYVFDSHPIHYLVGSEEELTDKQVFRALRWNGIDPYGVGIWEAPTLDQIPRVDLKRLDELKLGELYFLVQQKAEGKIKMIPAEKMNPIYGILTAEEAEEKWGLEPGTIRKRCETDWKDEVRQSQNTWLIPYDTVLKAYGNPAITRRINERKRKKAGQQ